MRRKKRKTLAKGIYEDASGRFIRISVNGRPVDLRREVDTVSPSGERQRGASYADREVAWLIKERIRRQAAASLTAERHAATATLFAADADRFLATIHSPNYRSNVASYMQHWIAAFGRRDRNTITDIEAQTAYAAIQKSASTKRHLRDALVHFYECLNGKSGYNPGRALVAPPKPKGEARALSYADIIEPIFRALPPSRAKARLMVMAYTSLPQSLIKVIQKHHLRLMESALIVSPRRKGRGVPARMLPLSNKGVEALREFDRLDAYGSFQNRQLMNTLKHGAKLAKVELPPTARPYDLRHSFLTEVYRQTGDLRAVSELGMHATLEQTSRYASGAVSERATKAIAAVPRFSTTRTRRPPPFASTTVARKSRARTRKSQRTTRRKRAKS